MPYARASDGIRLHYEVLGRAGAPAVLMIQGLGADKHGWDMQRIPLAFNYRVIALDNRGAGRSDKPFGHYSLEQMADDAITVLDEVGVERAHVVGASMGGAITQFIGLKYPDRVISLTLACTACRNHPWRKELLHGWATAATEKGVAAMTREAARWVIGPRSFRRLLPAFGWLGPLAMGRTSHAFASQVNAILDVDDTVADRLGEITAPTLVLVGNQDILTPRGDSEELAERLPNSELVVISGAAHGFMVEHATTFNRVLFDFLGRTTKAHRAAAAEPAAAAS
ncbi:MAG: alpha/beta fold hydrolase [Acidimicrobiaceae bacterium]|nr:alpha/beta fold hydrolase [Ilumatobacter sp.]MCB9380784.1 alpha/beta fold hydrolase [Acidimicrobiaceae bacterium]MCO5331474.1 alpha/beta hydrolase [Ilumatobacteraceae bacterium]